ncbi:MAG TPA: histidine kinase [Casimicrobiaceae bacterium]|nr:histidine kinase [Casimicrobiaceae bacterium]
MRNLGTILRILLGVNAAALVIAFAREPRAWALADEWAMLSGLVEPQLFAELLILWIIAPWLTRTRAAAAVAAVTVVTLAVGMGVHLLMLRLAGQPFTPPVRNLAFALLAQFVLLAYFRLRARALSPAITEARLQALQARIRPHFLFNSITAVLSLIRKEPRRAEAALEDLAELFRVLMRDNRDLAPLADEVELCRQYLDLEQLRLGDRLVVDWNVKSMPGDALVPPLVLQPLLENAVYHGIEPSSEQGVISINIFGSRDQVHAVLKNPYVADSERHRAGNRMAIANIRERLALHFDAEATLDSRVTRDGYEVHIRIPYRAATVPGADANRARREPYVGNESQKRDEPHAGARKADAPHADGPGQPLRQITARDGTHTPPEPHPIRPLHGLLAARVSHG